MRSAGSLVVVLLMVATSASGQVSARQAERPEAVPQLTTERLEGEWFEVATTGSFALRRCLSDTRHVMVRKSAHTLQIHTACLTARGVERRRGFLEGSGVGDGRYSLRYAPLVLSWAPAAWSDFWVLATERDEWLLVGDRRRRWFAVLSRVVALDEAALARAIAVARLQGYDPDSLRRVPQPAGASGLLAGR